MSHVPHVVVASCTTATTSVLTDIGHGHNFTLAWAMVSTVTRAVIVGILKLVFLLGP
jgi:hypothetical protein